jgi:hypothetical protein
LDDPILFQFPCIKELGEEAFNYVFEASELLAKLTEGLDPKTCKTKGIIIRIIINVYHYSASLVQKLLLDGGKEGFGG